MLVKWAYICDSSVGLLYDDGDIVVVSRSDFDRAFGAIVGASKEDVVRDFSLYVHATM